MSARSKPDMKAYWSKRENDFMYHSENNDARALCRLLAFALETAEVYQGRTFRQELESRGFDIKTMRFSVRKLEPKS